jgi:hypothetical protein
VVTAPGHDATIVEASLEANKTKHLDVVAK